MLHALLMAARAIADTSSAIAIGVRSYLVSIGI